MERLTIGWLLLSITMVFMMTIYLYDPKKKDASLSLIAASLLVLPLWWGLYFTLF